MVGFGMRTRGFLASWVSRPEKEDDPVFTQKVKNLDTLQATLAELQDNMKLYLMTWQTLCQASAAIAEGLRKLAGENATEGQSYPLLNMVNKHVRFLQGVHPKPSLVFKAHLYQSTQRSIQEAVKDPAQRAAEDMVLRKTQELLARFPPIYRKIERRRQLVADFTIAAAKVRAADAIKDKDRHASSTIAEQRRKLAAALETTATVVNGVTHEVIADTERLEEERPKMLVPQVSALVGCQAFFFRRSADILERLAMALPYSALALSRLVSVPPERPVRAVSAPANVFFKASQYSVQNLPAPAEKGSSPLSSISLIDGVSDGDDPSSILGDSTSGTMSPTRPGALRFASTSSTMPLTPPSRNSIAGGAADGRSGSLFLQSLPPGEEGIASAEWAAGDCDDDPPQEVEVSW